MVTQAQPIKSVGGSGDGEVRKPVEIPAPAPGSVDHAHSVDHEEGRAPVRRRSRKRWVVLAAVLGAATIGAAPASRFVRHAWTHESTDDAFLEAHVVPIAPKVPGYVQRLAVDDNQHVDKGDLLVQVDPRDYEVAVAQARAALRAAESKLAAARTQVSVQEATAAQAEADVDATRAVANQASADYARYQNVTDGAVSAQLRTNAEAAYGSAKAKVAAGEAGVRAARAGVENAAADVKTAEAAVVQAQTAVDQAELNLSYTKVTAPAAGRVARRSVEAGAYVQPGQSLLAVVPDDAWVVANFKETQLEHMRPGQSVEVTIDAYPAHPFKGHVDSIQSGTGSRFSMLPPENATGNYVKVVQRVPVKIVLDEQPPADLVLAPGMSVVPEVKVRD